VTGLRFQEPPAPPESVAGEGANSCGRFSLGRILSFDPGPIQQKVIPWAMKGGLALLDQGIFAGSDVYKRQDHDLVNSLKARS